jgi:hypothetical protein
VRTRHYIRPLFCLLLGALLTFVTRPVAAQDGGMLRGLQPEQVFEIALQLDDGATSYQIADLGGVEGVCDLAQPATARDCQIDLVALAQQFEQLVVVEYLAQMPESVQWHVGGPTTPVVLAADVRQWDAQADQARQWRVACSVLPDQPELAVCAVVNRLDHFNYVLVYSAALERVRVAVQGQDDVRN